MAKDYLDDIETTTLDPDILVSQLKQESAPETKLEKPAVEPELKESDAGVIGSYTQALFGPIGGLGEFYFPSELIGGCCPRVAGSEQDIVWNAAAEAADTERLHLAWQAKGDKIWYLAVRSAEMSSHPHTWCPFASLLPGMKDALMPPVCYTYYSDEAATMMTITVDGLQVHRGMSSVVRAKAERTARALGDAPVIELVPDRIEKLSPTPWYSQSLFEERARRILAAAAVAGAIVFAGLAVIIWFFAAMAMVSARVDKDEIQKRAEGKSLQLVRDVQALRSSPMREQLSKFAELNDGLLALDAFLDVYQIKSGKTLWRAIVPPSITSDRIIALGGKTLDNSDEGVIIGNATESLNLGKKGK
ncbi:MAG: hypothetical protein PHY92_03625 [Alphaproteobacteria bacterium]|nr:hypothetical protein [Alphaproteobacteria bacterium]